MTPSLARRRIALLAGALLLAAGVAASAAAALAETSAVENDSARLPQPPPQYWPPASPSYQATVRDLHNEYRNIFRHGNRNAASHRWATFLLERAPQMTPRRLSAFFEGFCAVSGSPVRPSDHNRYRLTLPRLGGGFATGYMHYCCWPCVCDTQDFIRVDTKNITLADGVERTYRFAVIGNPCDRPEQLEVPFVQPFDGRRTSLAESAREVRCSDDGTMEGATLSDHGYIIIGMFFDAEDARSSEHGVGGTVEGAREDLADPTPGRAIQDRLNTLSQPETDVTKMFGASQVMADSRSVQPLSNALNLERECLIQLGSSLGRCAEKMVCLALHEARRMAAVVPSDQSSHEWAYFIGALTPALDHTQMETNGVGCAFYGEVGAEARAMASALRKEMESMKASL